jgi:hypothetical protein
VVKVLVALMLILVPSVASASGVTPIEVLQREAVEQATPEQGPKPASSMFSDFSVGRAGHASWSLLIPGWAQYRAGNNGRAFLFASAEVAIWSVFAASKWQQSSREDTYQEFARNFAGVSNSDYDDDYWSAVGRYVDSDDYNEIVRRENRAAAEEQAINGEQVTIGINDGTVSSSDGWGWTSAARRTEYRTIRADAQTAGDRADAMLFFAVINRVVAFIEAFRSGPGSDGDGDIELYRVGEFELSVELDPNPLRPSGAVQIGRGF